MKLFKRFELDKNEMWLKKVIKKWICMIPFRSLGHGYTIGKLFQFLKFEINNESVLTCSHRLANVDNSSSRWFSSAVFIQLIGRTGPFSRIIPEIVLVSGIVVRGGNAAVVKNENI